MAGFLIALVTALLTGTGARDQILLAQMSHANRPRGPLLAIAIATVCLTTALAAWLAGMAAAQFNASFRLMLAGLALIIAGSRLLPVASLPAAKEPTQSLGAAAIVLFAFQAADAGRFSILAIALMGPPCASGWGGMLGGAVALTIGWHCGGRILSQAGRLHCLRQGLGAILIVAGLIVAGRIVAEFSVVDRFW